MNKRRRYKAKRRRREKKFLSCVPGIQYFTEKQIKYLLDRYKTYKNSYTNAAT